MDNCEVKIYGDGGPGLSINRKFNCGWADAVVHTKIRGYGQKDHYILMNVVQQMCQAAYEQGIEDATKEVSKLERIKRIIAE